MRTRGSYRIQVSNGLTIKTKNCGSVEDVKNEVIDITEENKPKKSKSNELVAINGKNDIIIIESDDEDIQMIDFNRTVHSSKTVSLPEKKPPKPFCSGQRPPIKKCYKCFRQIMTKTENIEYNRLTSADFYKNPRMHPSVISIELKDRTRINCYEESIGKNHELFANKTVLVIGSVTGLLALLVAKAKARNVIIFDCAGILQVIESVIQRNERNLSNKRTNFYFIRESIDEYVLPNGLNKVDVIVSDWVNHSLFYKSMIISFIKARDKWLRKGGIVFPDLANLYIAGAHDYIHKHSAKDKRHSDSLYIKRIDYWDHNVYGFDMTAVRHRVLLEPLYENVTKSQVITNEFRIKTYNLYELSLKDINFDLPFQLNVTKDHYLQTYVLFFDVVFSKHNTIPIMFSTRPTAYKHMFRPTVLFIEAEKQLTLQKLDKIKGNLKYELSPDMNELTVGIKFKLKNCFSDVEEELFYSTK